MDTVLIPVLLDNGNTKDIIIKLKEEVGEVEKAYKEFKTRYDTETQKHLEEEVFDVVQLAVDLLTKLRDFEGVKMSKANEHHIVKLINRQLWTFNNEFVKIQIPYRERL